MKDKDEIISDVFIGFFVFFMLFGWYIFLLAGGIFDWN
jgi:hypothetical protein